MPGLTEADPARTVRPTLREIARLAGVSVTTASFVLSGKGREKRISAVVEARVREIARQKDYSPNLLVRSLQRGRTNTLSFFNAFPYRDRGDLFQDGLFSAIERAADEAGYDVLLHSRRRQSVEAVYASLNGGRSDGLLFLGPQRNDPILALLRSSRLPTVILNHRDEVGGLSSVCADVIGGMRQAVDRLVALGHRSIAVLAGPLASWTWSDAHERVDALRVCLAEYGIAIPEERIVPMYDADQVAPEPEAAIRGLLSLPDPPTALFCWHDRIGYAALDACQRLGVRVPADLSLVGYDGLRWPSASGQTLASVAVNMDAVAHTAITLLDRLVDGVETAPVNLTYPVSLSTGTTLGPVRGH